MKTNDMWLDLGHSTPYVYFDSVKIKKNNTDNIILFILIYDQVIHNTFHAKKWYVVCVAFF